VKFVAGFVLGAAIGAVIAVIIAPRAGSELQESVGDLLDRGKTILDQAVDEGKRAADEQRFSLEQQVTS
jgi:gas vesicle protein